MASKKTATNEFTEVAHNVWLAGLGALASAGEESEKLFRTLVARGTKVEKRIVQPVDEAGSGLRRTVKDVRARASKSLGGFQAAIDDGVASALNSLGVPSRKEIAALSRRVERLTRAVDRRGTGKAAPARKKTAKKKTVRKKNAGRTGKARRR